ncbi:MAG: stage IV sporulation protein A, partial [Oscillospiraceae bacterium]
AAKISVGENQEAFVRLIDCVGYIVPSSLGYIENDNPRMVMTPWFEEEIPFNMAAEIGTKKVITEHSSIGVVITTDGSISDIPRSEYEEAEERVISELKELNKPFIVLLNCMYPNSKECQSLARELSEKYGCTVIPINCLDLEEQDITNIMQSVLEEFPLSEISIELPKWVNSLPKDHWLKSAVFETIAECCKHIGHIKEIKDKIKCMSQCEYINDVYLKGIDMGSGTAEIAITLMPNLLYKILQEQSGIEIENEEMLIPTICKLAQIKKEFEKVQGALDEVNATGYGIVMPTLNELSLEEPEIVKQGGRYGVRLKASAPSIHMMRADITTEVSPIVGSEKQSEELVMFLLKEFEESPEKIWESNIFGKSLHELVNEGLHNKLYRMPSDARLRLQETIQRIINEGCSGLICIIL